MAPSQRLLAYRPSLGLKINQLPFASPCDAKEKKNSVRLRRLVILRVQTTRRVKCKSARTRRCRCYTGFKTGRCLVNDPRRRSRRAKCAALNARKRCKRPRFLSPLVSEETAGKLRAKNIVTLGRDRCSPPPPLPLFSAFPSVQHSEKLQRPEEREKERERERTPPRAQILPYGKILGA